MKHAPERTKRGKKLPVVLLILLLLACAFFAYVRFRYPADRSVLSALTSDGTVRVSRTDYGWFFDGPSGEETLVFYPGAKVEAAAYAPMLRLLAERGVDVCLVRMPFELAFFDIGAAENVLKTVESGRRYVGGHSLGGAMAASWAAKHGEEIDGVILFAAYPTKPLGGSLVEITLYGSEDGVINRDKLEAGRAFAPERFEECVIEGGSHAGFGNYGPQKGDGTTRIGEEEQQEQAVDAILSALAEWE